MKHNNGKFTSHENSRYALLRKILNQQKITLSIIYKKNPNDLGKPLIVQYQTTKM